jgi:hypothetical protein
MSPLRPRPPHGAGRRRCVRRVAPRRRRPAARLRCPVCSTVVLPDDALGLVGGELAHAECALAHWLCACAPAGRRRAGELAERLSRWIAV